MSWLSRGRRQTERIGFKRTRFKPMRWSQALLANLGAAALFTAPIAAQSAPSLSPLSLDRTYRLLVSFPTAGQVDSPFWDRIDRDSMQTDEMISATEMSTPSLWYNREQLPNRLGGRRLINSWMAYEIDGYGLPVVDVVVNAQYWGVLNYLEQYGVVNTLGQSARDFGYNLRVYRGSLYNRELLGVYVCDFAPLALTKESLPLGSRASELSCRASLDMFGIQGFRGLGNGNSFFNGFGNGNGNGSNGNGSNGSSF
jgi:hypothetical protein